MKEILQALIIGTIVFGGLFMLIFTSLRYAKKEREKSELESESIESPAEMEYYVRVLDMRCTVLTGGTARHPECHKEFYVCFEILDENKNTIDDPMTLILDEETYLSLETGMIGHIAFSGDVFLGFIPEDEDKT